MPHFNSVSNCLEHDDLTPLLQQLVSISSLPLAALESEFAVDSTGLTTCRYARWFDAK